MKNLCQLNIVVFGISQNPNISRLSAVFSISRHGYTTGIYILSN